jgi:hypothetical protein
MSLLYQVIPSAMDDGTYACVYLCHQLERMSDRLSDVVSNPMSDESLFPLTLPILEDDWAIAQLPDTPALIHYPRANVEVSFLIGCGAVSFPEHGCPGTTRGWRLFVITVYFSGHRRTSRRT